MEQECESACKPLPKGLATREVQGWEGRGATLQPLVISVVNFYASRSTNVEGQQDPGLAPMTRAPEPPTQ